jgi:hypothetical protein
MLSLPVWHYNIMFNILGTEYLAYIIEEIELKVIL